MKLKFKVSSRSREQKICSFDLFFWGGERERDKHKRVAVKIIIITIMYICKKRNEKENCLISEESRRRIRIKKKKIKNQ